MKTVIVVDCSALAYAAFYAFGHLSYAGTDTGVIYGFLSKLRQIGEKFNSSDFILCWDAGKTHRHKDYKGYKQKRQDKRDEMTEQEARARMSFIEQVHTLRDDAIPAMGFKNNFHVDLYEADDLLAIWVRRMYAKGFKVIMVTSDQDMYQVLDCCDMYSPAKKGGLFTHKDLQKNYGIKAKQWAKAKAIGGCDGDNVIGIYGAADPKKPTSKALKYLQGQLTKGVIYDRITSKEGRKIIKKNLPIVTTPYKPELMPRMIRRRNKFTIKKFILTFERYGFRSFLEREGLEKWRSIFLNQ